MGKTTNKGTKTTKKTTTKPKTTTKKGRSLKDAKSKGAKKCPTPKEKSFSKSTKSLSRMTNACDADFKKTFDASCKGKCSKSPKVKRSSPKKPVDDAVLSDSNIAGVTLPVFLIILMTQIQ